MHIPYTDEFININQRIELTFKQVAYRISYSFMVDVSSFDVNHHLLCGVEDRSAVMRTF